MSGPWMKFYPSDWRADPRLRMCSIGARGLWIEMLCLMHEAEPYGYLVSNGDVITSRQLAKLSGISVSNCMKFLIELASSGVYSVDENKRIFSRRMLKDKAKLERDRENGKGGGNPNLTKGVNPPDKAHKPEARSQIIDRIGEAGGSGFTKGSKALSSAFWRALGFESPIDVPPQFAGVDWRAVGWESAGWTVDLIDAETRRIGPDKPLNYYEKVFATSFAKRQAPLPVVAIREAEKLMVSNYGKPKSAIIQAADDLCRKLASFDGPPGRSDELRGGSGKAPARLLSNG